MDEALKSALEALASAVARIEASVAALALKVEQLAGAPGPGTPPAPIILDPETAAQRALAETYRRPEPGEWPTHWPVPVEGVAFYLPKMTSEDLEELTLRARFGFTWAGSAGTTGPDLEAAHAEVDRIAAMSRAEYVASRYADVGGDFACGGVLTGLWPAAPTPSAFGSEQKPRNYAGFLTLLDFLKVQLSIGGTPGIGGE